MTKLFALALVAVLAAPALADTKTPAKPAPSAAAVTIAEIEKTFGFVPGFVRAIPPALLPSWWDGTKALQMNPNTALDGKTKELIGLAVAAATPCEYCVLFHTEAAKLNGATEQEIQEAVGLASQTRAGSTLLHGMQIDRVQFKKDIERFVKAAQAHAKK